MKKPKLITSVLGAALMALAVSGWTVEPKIVNSPSGETPEVLEPPPPQVAPKSTSRSMRESSSDRAISMRVRSAFMEEQSIRPNSIKVRTSDGVVRLTGTVNTQADADRAEELARSASGVVSVQNRLRVMER